MVETKNGEMSLSKNERWRLLEKQFANVEPKVKGLVVALNALEIKTADSCQGHRDTRNIQGPRITCIGNNDNLDVYLDEFYSSKKNRKTIEDNRLITEYDAQDNSFVLFNNDNRDQIFSFGRKEPIPRIFLYFYQRQMILFGGFLKDKYLNSEE